MKYIIGFIILLVLDWLLAPVAFLGINEIVDFLNIENNYGAFCARHIWAKRLIDKAENLIYQHDGVSFCGCSMKYRMNGYMENLYRGWNGRNGSINKVLNNDYQLLEIVYEVSKIAIDNEDNVGAGLYVNWDSRGQYRQINLAAKEELEKHGFYKDAE